MVHGAGTTDDAHDIVVGLDGSRESFAALRWALREAGLTGLRVNAVYGWTRSWDMGDEPQTAEDWERIRIGIRSKLQSWTREACEGMNFDEDDLIFTSVHGSGTTALLQIGGKAQQIVVGRRSMGRVMRWFSGSLSETLAEASEVPVTVVRCPEDDDSSVEADIENALSFEEPEHAVTSDGVRASSRHHGDDDMQLPVVVGVDGSDTSRRALSFALDVARVHRVPLHALFCWQIKDVGVIAGYENAVAPVSVAQKHAEAMLRDWIARMPSSPDVDVEPHAFHIPASKGLIRASQYASRVVVGSRGLSGLDAHFFGSVSKQIVSFAQCTVTVVH